MHILTVTQAEQGMKLIGFLSRRLGGAPAGELHRWIRTGQVRVNGRRARAFDRVASGDAVRLPPFAGEAARHETGTVTVFPGEILENSLRVIAVTDDFLALEKPAGLSSQPGSGQETSAADILRRHFASAAYVPAPAHRLDKPTSGILLAGRTHEAQEALHALFAREEEQDIEKTYLAWISGPWPHSGEQILADYLAKETETRNGRAYETVKAVNAEKGREARSRASLVTARETPLGRASLLRVTLETGRTHQIRAQLSLRAMPIIGDTKYNGRPYPRLLLHAHGLAFPWKGERVVLVSYPDWPTPFSVAQAPFVA